MAQTIVLENDPAGGSWHFDKRIPLALILAMAFQSGIFVYWMGGLSERVNNMERQLQSSAPFDSRLTRVEVKIEAIQGGIDRIERSIQQAPTPSPPH